MCSIELDMLVTYNPSYLHATDTLFQAGELFDEVEFRHVPVLNHDRELIGVVSDAELLRASMGYRIAREARIEGTPCAPKPPTVGDFMIRRVITATRADAVTDVVNRFLTAEVHSLPLVDGSRLEGIITAADVMREFSYCDFEFAKARVSEYMEEVDEPIESHATLAELKAHLQACGISHTIVMHGDCPLGIVSKQDLSKAKTRHALDFENDCLDKEPRCNTIASRLLTVSPTASLAEAAAVMAENESSAVAVTRGPRSVLGILTEDAILRGLQWELISERVASTTA